MSRGPGRWQRAVLDACMAAPVNKAGVPTWVSVDGILVSVEERPDRSARQHLATREAIRRAIRHLAADGRVTASLRGELHEVRAVRRWFGMYRGEGPAYWDVWPATRNTLHARRPLTDDELELEKQHHHHVLEEVAREAQEVAMRAGMLHTGLYIDALGKAGVL